MRRLTLAGISAALVLVIAAGCGGGSATPSPSQVAETDAPIATDEPVVESQAPEATDAPTAAPTGTIYHAVCGQVALREGPAVDDGLVVRVTKGTKVRVVEIVSGDAYEGGSCGESGDQWLKISKVAGKSVQTQYDVDAVYAAAGFFGEGQP
jgi:hypothetical protein